MQAYGCLAPQNTEEGVRRTERGSPDFPVSGGLGHALAGSSGYALRSWDREAPR